MTFQITLEISFQKSLEPKVSNLIETYSLSNSTRLSCIQPTWIPTTSSSNFLFQNDWLIQPKAIQRNHEIYLLETSPWKCHYPNQGDGYFPVANNPKLHLQGLNCKALPVKKLWLFNFIYTSLTTSLPSIIIQIIKMESLKQTNKQDGRNKGLNPRLDIF